MEGPQQGQRKYLDRRSKPVPQTPARKQQKKRKQKTEKSASSSSSDSDGSDSSSSSARKMKPKDGKDKTGKAKRLKVKAEGRARGSDGRVAHTDLEAFLARENATKDYWRVSKDLMNKVHEEPRFAKYNIEGEKELLGREQMPTERTTYKKFLDGTTKVEHDTAPYFTDAHAHEEVAWTGFTVFRREKSLLQKFAEKELTPKELEELTSFYSTRKPVLEKNKATALVSNLHYESPDQKTRDGILESRKAEWQKYNQFAAFRVISGEAKAQLLA